MVIKLYISGISGNKEVKKKQQRVQMILDSKQISYEAIDITEPGKEKDKEFMQQNGKVRESLGKYPLPPQIFNDDDFCGDYEDFDLANEVDELEKFLHIATNSKDLDNDSKDQNSNGSVSGQCLSGDNSPKKLPHDPYDYHVLKVRWDSVNGLQEEIISTNISEGELNPTEGVTKSEVNGETDAAPSSEPPTDDTGVVNPEVTSEVSNPAKEGEQESSGNENPEESTGDVVEGSQKNEEQAEGEDGKLEEEGEEEKTGNAEEKSPQSKEEEVEEEEEEKKEEEKEEEEEEKEEEEEEEEGEKEESKENLDKESKKENESEKEEEEEESENESEEKSQED